MNHNSLNQIFFGNYINPLCISSNPHPYYRKINPMTISLSHSHNHTQSTYQDKPIRSRLPIFYPTHNGLQYHGMSNPSFCQGERTDSIPTIYPDNSLRLNRSYAASADKRFYAADLTKLQMLENKLYYLEKQRREECDLYQELAENHRMNAYEAQRYNNRKNAESQAYNDRRHEIQAALETARKNMRYSSYADDDNKKSKGKHKKRMKKSDLFEIELNDDPFENAKKKRREKEPDTPRTPDSTICAENIIFPKIDKTQPMYRNKSTGKLEKINPELAQIIIMKEELGKKVKAINEHNDKENQRMFDYIDNNKYNNVLRRESAQNMIKLKRIKFGN